jgi:carboxymethylenebutenolidase
MTVESEYVEIVVDGESKAGIRPDGSGSPMRTFVAAPKGGGPYPGVVCFSDIYQLSPPLIRMATRLAGYGYIVAAPEIYHRIEPPGLVIEPDNDGRARGQGNAAKTPVAAFDADCRATLDYLASHPRVEKGKLLATGFCIGGHLAFRAAMQPDVRATACFYGTGIHNGKLGADADAKSLERAKEIRGELLMIFGTLDPHVPAEGRERVAGGLRAAGIDYTLSLYPAEHAFTRDDGPRYDPVATDRAFGEMVALFRHAVDPELVQ